MLMVPPALRSMKLPRDFELVIVRLIEQTELLKLHKGLDHFKTVGGREKVYSQLHYENLMSYK